MSLKWNLALDVGILGAFLVAMQPRVTGITIHEWLGVGFAATLIIHLLLHWKWVLGVARRFFQNLLHRSRLQLVADVLLFLAFIGVMTSGLVISREVLPFFGINLTASRAWRSVHSLTANASLAMVGVHLGLNARLIFSFVVKPIARRLRPAARPVNAPVAVVPVNAERNSK